VPPRCPPPARASVAPVSSESTRQKLPDWGGETDDPGGTVCDCLGSLFIVRTLLFGSSGSTLPAVEPGKYKVRIRTRWRRRKIAWNARPRDYIRETWRTPYALEQSQAAHVPDMCLIEGDFFA
jgi:hypothetical protein